MGNQQPKVTDIEYGWVAGFFDGEGTVSFAIRPAAGKNGGPKVHPFASVSGTEVEALEFLTKILDRANMAYHVAWTQLKGTTKDGRYYKPAWCVRMWGHQRCKRFLQWLTPALTLKKQRAELALDYIAEREAHTDFRTPITEKEWEMAMEMRRLNLKGKAQPFNKAVKLNTERPGASSERLAANGLKGAIARWGIRN